MGKVILDKASFPPIMAENVEIYTTVEPLNAVSCEYKGLLVVSQVKSRNMFADIGAGLKSLVGGELKSLSKLTATVREELLQELREKAVSVGANAVVGVRIETNSVFEGVLDMLVYGTAVAVTK